MREHEVTETTVILIQGPSAKHPDDSFRLEIMDLARVPREKAREERGLKGEP
jgi:hypothetical protein